MTGQVSHPYKTTGTIAFPCILIFIFLDSKLEDKIFCNICYYSVLKMKFFVTALSLVQYQIVIHCTPKYMHKLSAMFSGTKSTAPTFML